MELQSYVGLLQKHYSMMCIHIRRLAFLVVLRSICLAPACRGKKDTDGSLFRKYYHAILIRVEIVISMSAIVNAANYFPELLKNKNHLFAVL